MPTGHETPVRLLPQDDKAVTWLRRLAPLLLSFASLQYALQFVRAFANEIDAYGTAHALLTSQQGLLGRALAGQVSAHMAFLSVRFLLVLELAIFLLATRAPYLPRPMA